MTDFVNVFLENPKSNNRDQGLKILYSNFTSAYQADMTSLLSIIEYQISQLRVLCFWIALATTNTFKTAINRTDKKPN
jgi:hypothetical protein